MKNVYRIFPAIGIGRLGNSQNSFFLSPEIPNLGPLELTSDDSIKPTTTFKDENFKIKRQAARFRVYEFTIDDDNSIQSSREITSSEAKIEWQVELANLKAAAGRFESALKPETSTPRNPTILEKELAIKPNFPTISGINQSVKALSEGKFKGIEVFLGELKTDHKGRLLVLGGRGFSSSVPANMPLGDGSPGFPGHPNNNFANNEGWHDDVADGPVSATITFAGKDPINIKGADNAWVVIAPPDYSPYTDGITTLYDWSIQNALELKLMNKPSQPSFMEHIKPIIEKASNLKWVSSHVLWPSISSDFASLAKVGESFDQLRKETFELLMSISTDGVLNQFAFTEFQIDCLTKWKNGNFIQDFTTALPPSQITPMGLDKASLSQGVGGGFFPGIEAGIKMTRVEIYDTTIPMRLTRNNFTIDHITTSLSAGSFTRNMACPWQSDFFECEIQTGDGQGGEVSIWWPSQRPIKVNIRENNQLVAKDWIGVEGFNHQTLVDKSSELGIIEPEITNGKLELIEKERNTTLPRT